MNQLHILIGNFEDGPVQAASSLEQQLLALVRCNELVLHDGFQLPFTEQLLQLVSCDTVLCWHSCCETGPPDVQWSWLAVKAGVFVLDLRDGVSLTITECRGALPRFALPWALVIAWPGQGTISGLPLHLFQSGPKGCLVWRNSAMTFATLEAALVRLGWK